MSGVEIVLLLFGAAIFIVSFFLPEGKAGQTVDFDPDELKRAIDSEVERAKKNVTDICDETVRYSVEKAEISLDRISNEKIMAVDEYSQEVLSKIDKNHQEVVFLFDMLNEKSVDLKNTVRQAQQIEKDARETIKETHKIMAAPETVEPEEKSEVPAKDFVPLSPMEVLVKRTVSQDLEAVKAPEAEKKAESPAPKRKTGAKIDMALNEAKTPGKNKNEMILQLHRMGKSNVEVARELGLGTGEVKLVVDLFS